MAVTSLWRIHGNIKKVLLYAANEEKTTITENIKDGEDELQAVLSYASRSDATKYVTGLPVPRFATYESMLRVKKQYGKTDGVTAYHGYQSFEPGEVTPEVAHEIGVKLAKRLWADRYQVLVCTHIDKQHIHNHFVINTVSYVDGIKFRRTKEDYKNMQLASDELCKEYGLSVPENKDGKRKHYETYIKEKSGAVTQSQIIRDDIDECVNNSESMQEFYYLMERRGYTFNFSRAYTTITHKNFSRPRRLKTLGDEYVPAAILERIKNKDDIIKITELEQDDIKDIFFYGDANKTFENYQVVFVAFVSGLRYIKAHPNTTKRLKRLIGEELEQLDKLIEEQELLVDNNLESLEDISAYKDKCENDMNCLLKERDIKRNELRNAQNRGSNDVDSIKNEVSDLTKQIAKLRKDIRICDRGISAADRIEKDMVAIREEDKVKDKQINRNQVR